MDDSSDFIPKELINFLKSGSNFIIAGHKEPDGDCVGSQLALRSALERIGKKAVVCSAGPFIRSNLKKIENQFLDLTKLIGYLKNNTDVKIIIVDCSTMERIGSLQEELEKYPYAVIDHHAATNHPPSTETNPVYIDSASPSCTFMIEKIISSLGLELTFEEAEHLLFGLCTDTGFFRHLTEKNSDVFEAASRMIKKGASPKKCFNIMNGGKSLKSRLLMGNILSRTESFFDGKLLLSYETLEDFNNYGLESRDSDTLNQLLLSIEGIEALAVIRQESENTCNVSLRSVDKIDVAQIAASFGGGGHKNASGFTMQGQIPNMKTILLDTFKNHF